MRIAIHPNKSGGFDLLVNGKGYVFGESFNICSAISDAILSGATGTTEADEVAQAIIDSVKEGL